jgi:hypothetical protein
MARNPETCDLLCLDLPKAERMRGRLPERRPPPSAFFLALASPRPN